MTRITHTNDGFVGPDEFATQLVNARRVADWEKQFFGDISAENLQRSIRIAYYASQSPNEGRFPRLTLLVPAKGEIVNPLVPLQEELNVASLRRLGPILASPDNALAIREQDGFLRIVGIAALRGLLTEIDMNDQSSHPAIRPRGLAIEITGPGELRASEARVYRLQSGTMHQEVSFGLDGWFKEWYDEAAADIFDTTPEYVLDMGWEMRLGYAISNVWYRLLSRAADLHHGGCFVILREPSQVFIQRGYRTPECDLRRDLSKLCKATLKRSLDRSEPLSLEDFRLRQLRRQRIISTVDAIAHLSATDGCVVFNRRLDLHSFGNMIEIPQGEHPAVPCYKGDTSEVIDEETLKRYGARRLSALHLCQACPGAMAFVISQDGDLRIFVSRDGVVRFYDKCAYW